MSDQLTDRQSAIVEFVERHHDETDSGVSLRAIMGSCGISSTSVASYNVRRLADQGEIEVVCDKKGRAVPRGILPARRKIDRQLEDLRQVHSMVRVQWCTLRHRWEVRGIPGCEYIGLTPSAAVDDAWQAVCG